MQLSKITLWQDPTPRAAVHGGSAAAQGPQFLLHSGRHLVRRDADEGRCFLVGSPAISDLRILTLQLDEHGGSPVRVRGDLQARESSVEIPWNQIGVGGLHDGVGCGLDRGAAYMGGGGCVREERSIQLQQPLTALRQHFLCRELVLGRQGQQDFIICVSLLVNRLSGKIPKHVGNITTLTYLMLEANNFSGVVPPELGKLINLQTFYFLKSVSEILPLKDTVIKSVDRNLPWHFELSPPYLTENGRHCSYFRRSPPIKDLPSVEVDKASEVTWLKETQLPENLMVKRGQYIGPTIRRR
ncbi:Plant cysteine oxidase [Arachis hypogaea]|nr:Plant cysteine oxidase [Arachis hypogaea]